MAEEHHQHVRAAFIWQTKVSAVKKHMVKGHMVGTVKRFILRRKQCRVHVEIVSTTEDGHDRLNPPLVVHLPFDSLPTGDNFPTELHDNETIRILVFRPATNDDCCSAVTTTMKEKNTVKVTTTIATVTMNRWRPPSMAVPPTKFTTWTEKTGD